MPVPRMDNARPNVVYWYAGIDFDERNLTCPKGDPLPNRWQHREQVAWLRSRFGATAVLDAGQMEASAHVTASARVGAPAGKAEKRGARASKK